MLSLITGLVHTWLQEPKCWRRYTTLQTSTMHREWLRLWPTGGDVIQKWLVEPENALIRTVGRLHGWSVLMPERTDKPLLC